jgi:hypothetical protein
MAGFSDMDGGKADRIAAQAVEWVEKLRTLIDPSAPLFWTLVGLLILVVFLLGWRLGSSKRPAGSMGGVSRGSLGLDALVWRHEKLVLSERLQAEREARLEGFGSRILGQLKGSSTGHSALRAEVGLFLLGERFRDERGRVGSELSRWQAVANALSPNPTATKDPYIRHRELVAGLIHQLELSRDCLREAQLIVVSYEEACAKRPEPLTVASMSDLLSRLSSPGSPLASLDTLDLSDQFASLRSLIADGQVEEWVPIQKYLLLDGADAKPAPPSFRSWLKQLASDLGAGDDIASALPAATENLLPSPQASPASDRAAGPYSEAPYPEDELIVFCSNRVDLWGQEIYRGNRHRARRLDSLPTWSQWISLTRLDTGERLFVPAANATLGSSENESSHGFNGSGETYYGARHLGVFSADCPNEIETRFTYGGWGFGHRSGDIALASENLQASGWAGREIPGDTVFKIALHANLPDLGPRDTVLGGDS